MKRRIIAALAAMGLTAAMAVGVAPAAQAEVGGGALYVALGDSVASGNGNLPYIDDECLRSARSYPMLLGAAMGSEPVSVACTGATIDDVLGELGDLVGPDGIGPATRLVTLTVGINDLGWQAALAACATPGMEALCASRVQEMAAAGLTIPGKLMTLLVSIRGVAPEAAIVVTGYARLFGEVSKSCSIGNLAGTPVKLPASLTAAANVALDGMTDAPGVDPMPGLNDAIAGTVAQFAALDGRTMFVDVDPAFQTHRVCDTGDRWISGLVNGVPKDRGLHPNAAGQKAIAASILAAMP